MGIVAEICIDSVDGVRAAEAAGASRVELCSALLEGGLTPSLGMVRQAMAAATSVAVHVMIRPRGGDFFYSDDEFAAMVGDVEALAALGVHGFVFGLLNPDGGIDMARTRELVTACQPAAVTFHRAFDMNSDPVAALEALIELGVDRVLTSGQAPSVLEGAPLIARLIQQAADRVIVMPGGDITSHNVARIVADTGAREIHFAALETRPGPMVYRNPDVFMGGCLRPPEYERTVTTSAGVAAVLAAVGQTGG